MKFSIGYAVCLIGLFFGQTASVALPTENIPPNTSVVVRHDSEENTVTFIYAGGTVFRGKSSPVFSVSEKTNKTGDMIEQQILLKSIDGSPLLLTGMVTAGPEALAAETRGTAQQKFPMVRTSHGLSHNLRNNAVYSRNADWMIEWPHDGTRITPVEKTGQNTNFEIKSSGKDIKIIFRPRYYQKHKNINNYQPWTYSVRKDSISGWCSWWAYKRGFNQLHLETLLDVWQTKNLDDYGYRFIQIDDGYQGAADANRKISDKAMRTYIGGRPETWLNWRKNLFPNGKAGYVQTVRNAGFEPGVWLGCFFTDLEIAQQHPDWFVRGKDGSPYIGPWVTYAIDTTNPEAAEALVKPTYKGIADTGFSYVKIDQLRHYLYDNIHLNTEYCQKRGVKPADLYRSYLQIARKELGPDTFILSCWGVLPESVGIADACRIGGDGYGPVTMQQYNSWNGIVWRNDPDHCDIYPTFKPAEVGNVRKVEKIQAANNDTIIRPALASIAGCMLMLSDRPEVYRDDRNLVGARKSAPVLFSVPGQLYDFDEVKTDRLKTMSRLDIKSGSGISPIDGDQFGKVCPWWLNEFSLTFENWNVLHRLNWSDNKTQQTTVLFADLGLDASKEYLVYEFWTDTLVGVCKKSFTAKAQLPMQLDSFAIRPLLPRPQIISTSRHLSQGAVDLIDVEWNGKDQLSGSSRVITDNEYTITLHVPDGFKVTNVKITGLTQKIQIDGRLAKLRFTPRSTGTVQWAIQFEKHG